MKKRPAPSRCRALYFGGAQCCAGAWAGAAIRKASEKQEFSSSPLGDEGGHGRLHHLDGAAQVHLVAAEVGKVGQHGFVHQAGAAGQASPSLASGHHGHHGEVGMLALPLLAALQHVEVLRLARAPVQAHGALHAARKGVFDDALDGRKARGPGR